jgi:hypothetical protein
MFFSPLENMSFTFSVFMQPATATAAGFRDREFCAVWRYNKHVLGASPDFEFRGGNKGLGDPPFSLYFTSYGHFSIVTLGQ